MTDKINISSIDNRCNLMLIPLEISYLYLKNIENGENVSFPKCPQIVLTIYIIITILLQSI